MPWTQAGPAAVALGLCLLVAVATSLTVAQTALAAWGGQPVLAAAAGVLVARALSVRGRERGLGLLLLVSALMAVPLAFSAGAPSGTPWWSTLAALLLGNQPEVARAMGLMWLCWATGAWVGWCALAEGQAALATSLPLVVLVADLINTPHGSAGRPALWVALAVVSGLSLMGWTQVSRLPRRGPGASPGRLRAVGVTAVCVATVTAVAVLVPPLNRVNFSGRYFHYAPPGTALSPASGSQPRLSGFASSVVPGGPLELDTTPLFEFRASPGPQPVYLEAVALGSFRQGNWYQAPGRPHDVGPGQALAGTGTAAMALPQAGTSVRLTVTYLPRALGRLPFLLYPGTPLAAPRDPVEYEVRGGGAGLEVSSIEPALGLAQALPLSLQITTVGADSQATEAQLEAASRDYPSWTRQYLSLGSSAELAPIRRAAERMAGGATNPFQVALNVAQGLRAEETYTLDPPRAPAGVWPVDYFLTTSHLGYCQYFASAMGAMLRSLGIPARLVSGFAPQGSGSGSPTLVRESDAHSWVQAYFPSYGWITFDPTPSAGGVALAPGRTAPNPVTSLAVRPTQHPGVRPWPPADSGGPALATVGPSFEQLAPVAAVLVALMLLGGWGWLSWGRRPRGPAELRRRLALLARLGGQPHPDAFTLGELASFCRWLQAGPRDLGVDAALVRLCAEGERTAYAHAPEPQPRERYGAGWERLRRHWPTLLWRAWRAGQRPSFTAQVVRR
ncbi:MAG: transglutaminase domain-containing protein [Candidatus Dormibacteria bacterium]